MSEAEERNSKKTGRDSKKNVIFISSVVFVLLVAIIGFVVVVARRNGNKAEEYVDLGRKNDENAVKDKSNITQSSSTNSSTSGSLTHVEKEDGIKQQQNTDTPSQLNIIKPEMENDKKIVTSKQSSSDNVTKLQQSQEAEKENDKKEIAPKQSNNDPAAGQETIGVKLQEEQRAQQLNKVSPELGDACDKLENDLKADGIWKLSDLEASFNALQAHLKKDDIVALYPELAGGSVYEAYFDKFKDKIDALMNSKGALNILNASDIMDHLAHDCKSKLDAWISSECTQIAGTTVLSDQCYYLRKVSIVQGLKDAFYTFDFIRFKTLLEELTILRRSCSTFDESMYRITYEPRKRIIEANAGSFGEGLLDIRSAMDRLFDGDKNENLSTHIGKLDRLKKICELLNIDTDAIIAKKKELVLNIIDNNNINDPNLVTIMKDKTSGMDPNDLDVPYFTTQTTPQKVLEFWRAQQCKMILDKSKMDNTHTSANAFLGKNDFKDRFGVLKYVNDAFVGEVERLKTGVFKSVSDTPPNEAQFMEFVMILIRLHRSLKDQEWAEHEVLRLRNEENAEIQDLIISILGPQLVQGRYVEFEALANFSKEIGYQLKLPDSDIEINTKDEFDEARRIIVVRNNFDGVADGEFFSKLPLINAELARIGLEVIDEAVVRRILVKTGKFRELVRSDDPNHTQYKAIKTEISNQLKNMVQSLNDDESSVFNDNITALRALMKAWRDLIDAADEIEPKYVRPDGWRPKDAQIEAEINSYYCSILTEKVNDLNSSIRTTIVPGYYEKMILAMDINTKFNCEIQDARTSIMKEEAISTFYVTENTATYDQKTDLPTDPFFQKYKTFYNRMREPTADVVLVLNLYLAKPPNEPAKSQSCNLLAYHYLVPEITRYEYKAGCSDRAVANDSIVDLYRLIQRMSLGIYEPAQAMTLRVLRTQNIAGRDGNGLIMFWHDPIGKDGLVKLYSDLQEAKANVVDPLISNALGNLKDAYSRATTTSELKRVYMENYEVLKSLHGNPNDFPPLL